MSQRLFSNSAGLLLAALAGVAGCDGTRNPAWYYTCGDPVCQGYAPRDGGVACSTERAGDPCTAVGQQCDPRDDCNRQLVCATTDPTRAPGGCPISRRAEKRDIVYLGPSELERIHHQVRALKLATYRYRFQAADAPRRLGFMIDDQSGSPAVDPERDMVDLYGYTSMAVAALQSQAQEIETLQREVTELRQGLEALRKANAERHGK
ncbi:MAG TPA: hypothetical protein VH877_24910 [Polyangia bacterium]|jgi:hypothetical protein|nr:hypothetical protein [Polyangia bacterium]